MEDEKHQDRCRYLNQLCSCLQTVRGRHRKQRDVVGTAVELSAIEAANQNRQENCLFLLGGAHQLSFRFIIKLFLVLSIYMFQRIKEMVLFIIRKQFVNKDFLILLFD